MRDRLVGPLLRQLPVALRHTFPRVPPDVLETAATDAILELLSHPGVFDAARGVPLDRFLRLPAQRNVLDWLRDEGRRRVREAEAARVQACADGGADARALERRHDIEILRRILTAELDAAERAALDKWLAGGGTPDLAAALGFGGRPAEEQRGAVKRFKDRLLKRLGRILGATRGTYGRT